MAESVSKKEYDKLFAQYNLAVTQCKDLKEQLATKNDQWHKIFEENQITEKIMREFCMSILARDRERNALGKENNTNNLSINELIRQAKKFFDEYNYSRTKLMNEINDAVEKAYEKIIDLEEENKYLKANKTVGKSDEEEKKNKKEKKAKNTNTSKLAPAVQTAAEKGKVTIEEAEDFKENGLVSGEAVVIWDEDDEEIVDGEVTDELHKDNIKTSMQMKATPHSIKSLHGEKGKKKREKMIKEAESEVYGDSAKEIEEKINSYKNSETYWKLIKIIGDTGLSLTQDIAEKYSDEMIKEGKSETSRNIIYKISDLTSHDVLFKEIVKCPFGKFTLVKFRPEGMILYRKKYKKNAVKSEWDKIEAEHTTLEHGYGILQCSDVLKSLKSDNKKIFEKVQIYNRNNPIKVGKADGDAHTKYIPDLICTDKNNVVTYIEYELNNHTKTNLFAKCSKMVNIGLNRLNFITPNTTVAVELCKRLKDWVDEKGVNEVMRHIMIRVTTAKSILGHDLRHDSEWLYTFRPGKDKEFNKNF